MKMRQLGRDGPGGSAIGLGCMRMTPMMGQRDTRGAEAKVATLPAALDAGMTLLNTGDVYAMARRRQTEAYLRPSGHGRLGWSTAKGRAWSVSCRRHVRLPACFSAVGFPQVVDKGADSGREFATAGVDDRHFDR